jgi:apolipoprotein N-acyltransferase
MAAASGGLLWLCYFPLALGWLAWFALVPLLTLVRTEAPPRLVYLAAWLSGLVFSWPALQWLRVADDRMYFTWAFLAMYCSLFVPLRIFLVRRLDRHTRLPLILTLPAVWTALEYFQAHFITGFAWYFLGHTQHASLAVVQIADLAGAYAVTFLVAAVNAGVFELLYASPRFRSCFALREPAAIRSRWSFLIHPAMVLFLLGASLGYGAWRLGQVDFAAGPRVALIQGNLDQRIRNAVMGEEDRDTAVRRIARHYFGLCDQAAGQRPDLIVWPETSLPVEWVELAPGQTVDQVSASWREALASSRENAEAIGRKWHANVLLGLNSRMLGGGEETWRYNSALLLGPTGREDGRYDKIHRVPFGEYIPLRDWLPWLNRLAPYDFDYSVRAGEHQTRFALPTADGVYHFGVIICFEDTDPPLARQYVRPSDGEPAADFLVNISNDGWFNGESEHEEHLAICRFRAVECRRAVARAVNMGISAVIDGNGRVVALPGETWSASKKTAAVVTAAIPLDRRASLYARWGDWLPALCWGVVTLGLLKSYGTKRVGSAVRTG